MGRRGANIPERPNPGILQPESSCPSAFGALRYPAIVVRENSFWRLHRGVFLVGVGAASQTLGKTYPPLYTTKELRVETYFPRILILLAQQPPEGPGILGMLIPMLAIGFLFYFLLIVPQRKEQRKRQQMLGALKKNDRVITIGGIYGVVANVHREADEVTLKVDEATNTKIRVSLSAIARVLGEGPSEENT